VVVVGWLVEWLAEWLVEWLVIATFVGPASNEEDEEATQATALCPSWVKCTGEELREDGNASTPVGDNARWSLSLWGGTAEGGAKCGKFL
jgi:hypothetical protein